MPKDMKGVSETDLVLPTLRLAATRPNGEISTSDLIVELTEVFNPTGKDAEIIPNRSDTYFSQKVRNLISHRGNDASMFASGYAEYTGDGVKITQAGRTLVKMLGG